MEKMGEPVDIDGVKLNIYSAGESDKTLVFMSGFGSCSPILDFKGLCNRLNNRFKTVVIEKPGYGFSAVSNSNRDLQTMVNEQRAALKRCGIMPPYILCPLSISGLEAIFWAGSYPKEISAIVGLDMSFPEIMQQYKFSVPFLTFSGFVMRSGIARLFPKLAHTETYKYGNLNEDEKDLYVKLFYKKTMSRDMINEGVYLKQNIKTASSLLPLSVPMLLFVSNGEDTGIDKDLYVSTYNKVLEKIVTANVIRLDCSHFVHLFQTQRICEVVCEKFIYSAATEHSHSV